MKLTPDDLGLVYLATVYSSHPEGLEIAFQQASRLAAELLKRGYRVYSPIAHTHPIAVYGNVDPYDHSIWLPFDKAIMDKADTLMVATMPNWQVSKGITFERKTFIEQQKPTVFVNPKTLEITKSV